MTGPASWLDEDELDAALRAGLLDEAMREQIAGERATLDARLAAGDWPPAITREIGLAEARRSLSATD